MNENHALCSTPEWAEFMEAEVLEPVTAGLDLGDEMLELGPGPGATTRWLRHHVKRLVALELDPDSAARLANDLAGTNVEVEVGDARRSPFAEESFDSAAVAANALGEIGDPKAVDPLMKSLQKPLPIKTRPSFVVRK